MDSEDGMAASTEGAVGITRFRYDFEQEITGAFARANVDGAEHENPFWEKDGSVRCRD